MDTIGNIIQAMEFIPILLFGIIVILGYIASALNKIANRTGSTSFPSLYEIEEKLEKIYKILGGEQKDKDILENLKSKYTKYLSKDKGIKIATKETEKLFSNPEFETFRLSTSNWVEQQEAKEWEEKYKTHDE